MCHKDVRCNLAAWMVVVQKFFNFPWGTMLVNTSKQVVRVRKSKSRAIFEMFVSNVCA